LALRSSASISSSRVLRHKARLQKQAGSRELAEVIRQNLPQLSFPAPKARRNARAAPAIGAGDVAAQVKIEFEPAAGRDGAGRGWGVGWLLVPALTEERKWLPTSSCRGQIGAVEVAGRRRGWRCYSARLSVNRRNQA